MNFAQPLRAAALLTAVALLPATTAGLAQVDGRASPEFAKLFATYQRIKTSYVEPVEDEVLVRGAIDGMLAALDPHSEYLDGADLERLETMIDGNYQGLGISVQMDDGAVKVVSPFKGSPADKAGIKAGDYITHIEGKLIYGLKLDEAVKQMRGTAGSPIKLSVFRPGRDQPFDVTVVRGVIELEPVTHELKDGGVGYISVNEFSRDVGADVNKALADLRAKAPGGKLNGLVLDLRRNPGGSLDEAVALSDLFLTNGEIVSQRGRRSSDTIYYPAERVYKGDAAKGTPMIVLIDEGSASASEIVAGALQDQHRALIMGERSFGKGSVQTLLPLTKDSALKLTTARYFTPSGRSVQEGGIEPDIRVPQLTDEDAAKRRLAYRESDLRGHLINEATLDDKELESDKGEDPRFTLTAAELEKQGIKDFQLDYALKTLRRTAKTVVATRN